MTCPFCHRNPYHYVDNGVGMMAVGVDCCSLGVALFQYKTDFAKQTLEFMQSDSPHEQAIAEDRLRHYGLHDAAPPDYDAYFS